jgi:dTDP-4-amino-4,6-dideoxygalactose transaminase
MYNKELAGLSIELPKERPDTAHVYHLYVIVCGKRDQLKEMLAKNGVLAGVHYPVPSHLHGGYGHQCKLPSAGLFVTEGISGKVLSLPMYPEMTSLQVAQVIDHVPKCLSIGQ